MAEPMLALAVLQVVTPVALAVMPAIWKQMVKVLRGLTTETARDPTSQDMNVACIHTILDTLGRLPSLSWTSESHIQALLKQLKIRTESLRKMIENEYPVLRSMRKGRFAKRIQCVAVMMQILETNVRARQGATFLQCNANRDVKTDRLDLGFYTESKENLMNDLRAVLRADNLKAVEIDTWEDYEASIEKLDTYPRIRYEFRFEGAPGYSRTLTTSRGVRECIELLLRRLRDLKLMQKNQHTGGSVLIGVALYEIFTEILPKVLMDDLVERRSTLHPRTAQQLCKNLKFFRLFSTSSTFKAIQGPHGLELEEEDKLNIDLQKQEWVTWEDVERASLEVGTGSSGGATRTASGNIESHECVLCGLYIAGQLLGTELARHSEACYEREKRLNSFNSCPVCHLRMDHLSEEERIWHTNACLDTDASGSATTRGWRSGRTVGTD